jgi:hypothetical protein
LIFRRSKKFEAKQLIGKWRLEKIASRDPSKFKIASWVIEFKEEGKWEAAGFVIGPWDSMQLKGSATWRLEVNRIFFDTGNKETECGIKFYGEKLLLFDDPLITPRLGNSAEFRYIRVKE